MKTVSGPNHVATMGKGHTHTHFFHGCFFYYLTLLCLQLLFDPGLLLGVIWISNHWISGTFNI